jgi:WD40 repeat protein
MSHECVEALSGHKSKGNKTMTANISIYLCRRFIWSCLALAIGLGMATAATNPPPQDTPAALGRLQEQLDQQTKRIDRLYKAIGPHLAELEERAAKVEKQQQEDKALALEQICDVKDESLTAIGCINPVAAEFAVITTDGGVRIFDGGGKSVKELQSPGQEITCIAFSPGGSELLTGTASGALLIWEVAKGSCVTVCTNVGRKVDRVTWLGKDRVAWGGNVKYWNDGGKAVDHDKPAGSVLDRATGQLRWTFRGFVRNDFFTLAGAPDGSLLAVLEIPGQPRGAFLLEGSTGEVRHTCYDEEHGSGPLSLRISPDGKLLAVGYAPYDIILWNAQTGMRQKLLKGHSNWVVSLAFSADGKRLISGAGDSTARIWDVESGKEIGRVRLQGESSYVEGVGLSPKGDIAFAVAGGDLVVARVAAGGK